MDCLNQKQLHGLTRCRNIHQRHTYGRGSAPRHAGPPHYCMRPSNRRGDDYGKAHTKEPTAAGKGSPAGIGRGFFWLLTLLRRCEWLQAGKPGPEIVIQSAPNLPCGGGSSWSFYTEPRGLHQVHRNCANDYSSVLSGAGRSVGSDRVDERTEYRMGSPRTEGKRRSHAKQRHN